MRPFVAIAFAAALFGTGPAAAHFAKAVQAESPLQLVQDKDKGKKKKAKKSTKDSGPKAAPAQPAQRY